MLRSTLATRAAAGLFALALLAACHTGARGNDHVTYDGGTLTVDGKAYAREPADPATQPGHLIATVAPDFRAAAIALARRNGLELTGQSDTGELLFAVPEGFEAQWAAALGDQLGVHGSAEVHSKLLPTHFGAPDPGLLAAADTASPSVFRADDAPSGKGEFKSASPASPAAPAPPRYPVPAGEPPADVVRRLVMEENEAIERNGGTPLTLTATGKSFIAHRKIFSAVKDECHPVPQGAPGEFECGALLKAAMCADDCDPSQEEPLDSATRVFIRWDGDKGEWVND